MDSSTKKRRILLKLSGEALAGAGGFGVDPGVLRESASLVRELLSRGIEVALVIGGGNIFRGAALQKAGFDRTAGDQMGMLATVMNGIAMREELIRQGACCDLLSAHGMPTIATQYEPRLGRNLLAAGHAVIVAGGTGSPFFTTDTAAVLRAVELSCDEVLKGTKVDGIYSADPMVDKSATKFPRLTFAEVISKELKVMDLTAFALAREHNMPIRVFCMQERERFLRAALGEDEGSLVKD
ncbi:MAG: UMP kinase [Succinivibrionaceae bacterium]|nr:UMP kinase [Succinivibrionaceae bacterium]